MTKRALFLLAVVVVFGSQAWAQQGQGAGGTARTKENLDLPYDALGLNEDDEDAPEVIIFYGQNYEGDGIFYALDRSGSTRDGELNREKQEVVKNINEFSEHVQFGIVFYDRGIQKHPANSRPAQASAAGKGAAIAFVMSRQPGSGTCSGKGVTECITFANASSAKRNVIIYIGDGCTTCPGHDARTYAKQALGEVQGANFKRHQINSIRVGNDNADCDYWAKPLADMNGGKFSAIAK